MVVLSTPSFIGEYRDWLGNNLLGEEEEVTCETLWPELSSSIEDTIISFVFSFILLTVYSLKLSKEVGSISFLFY